MHFLIVDDDVELANLIAKNVRSLGNSTVVVSTLEAANDALRQSSEAFDVVLADINLGADRGTDIVAGIRARFGSYPTLIFLTGDDDFDDKESYDLGADAVFRKGRNSLTTLCSAATHFHNKNHQIRRLLEEQEKSRIAEEKQAEMLSLGSAAFSILHEIANSAQLVAWGFDSHANRLADLGSQNLEQIETGVLGMRDRIERLQTVIRASTQLFRSASQEMSSHQVSVILSQMERIIGDRLRKSGVKFDVRMPAPDLAIICHPIYVHQIITNLVFNSHDALVSATHKWITISAQRRDTEVQIDVVDSGAGVPFDLRSKIFDLRFTTKEQGSGVGLHISRTLAEKMRGKLWLDQSQANTTFSLLLPAAN